MSFVLRDYYDALNRESSLARDTWYTNYDKRHVFKISSDRDAVDGSNQMVVLPPSAEETLLLQKFSDQLNQKIKNTKIVAQDDGTEEIQLELEDRIITIVMDHSGSMTWSDSGNFRYQIAEELVEKITANYPGDISYNLIAYGGTLVNVMFFGLIDEGGIDVTDLNSVTSFILANEDANFAGVRIMKSTIDYPSEYGGLDGEEVADGFISKALDTDLISGQTVYYRVFTYDRNGKMSHGTKIKVTPRNRIVPRGISIFRTAVESSDLTTGAAFVGRGIQRDANTIGIWHMDEGQGRYVFDFSDSALALVNANVYPIWYDSRYVPAGISGLLFNGETDYLQAEDTDNHLEFTWGSGNADVTISAWIYPYPSGNRSIIFSRGYGSVINYAFGVESDGTLFFDNGTSIFTGSTIAVEYYKWQYVSVTCDGTNLTYHINNQTPDNGTVSYVLYSDSNPHYVSIGANPAGGDLFIGRITEVSIHNSIRSASYLTSQLSTNSIYDSVGNEIDTEIIGLKDDNGDRLVVLKYEIPADYDFSGGQVRIIRNDKRIPSWEEDILHNGITGDIVSGKMVDQSSPSVGVHYVTDADDFVLGETYYYRIFSQNSLGNFSFSADSPSLTVFIPQAETGELIPDLSGEILGPQAPSGGQPSITGGNHKVYLRWENPNPADDRIKRVKIYCSNTSPPIVSSNGISGANLVYTGLPDEQIFVHRDLTNDITYYYTIVFVDKYGRSSNYDEDGIQASDFFSISATPSDSADEGIIPLPEVNNLCYEIVDDSSVSVKWDSYAYNPETIDAYFDQTVLLYSAITDEFGAAISSDTPIKMSISADIVKEDQSEDVFRGGRVTSFTNDEAYDFFVTRTDEGVVKATLKMTGNVDIISQIKSASFTVQLKAYIPKEGGTSTPANSTTGTGIESLEEYARVIEQLVNEIDGTQETTVASDNVFEYYSRSITINFTNPWEIQLVNRDNLRVFETCYVQQTDPITGDIDLKLSDQTFNGVYMGSSTPFVARAKVKYKGQPVNGGQLRIAIWDADFSNLCGNAGGTGTGSYEGEKIGISTTVFPPQENVLIKQGTEEKIGPDGQTEDVPISYVDIPIYAPDKPHAIRLYVKGSNAGYTSMKDMYILFQSILKITFTSAKAPTINGREIAEQFASVFIVNPDYPNYLTNSYDRSLTTYPVDNTVVEWKLTAIQGGSRSIYSIDNVPLTNGVYSYTRNGSARNVFFGPIERGNEKIDETHELSVRVVYQGLVASAKQYLNLWYDPQEAERIGSRFLMEKDGGYLSSGAWGGGGWLDAGSSPMWADGEDYRRIKIHHNPRIATDFEADNAFRTCAAQDDNEMLELGSGQYVTITTGDSGIEVVHGDVSEFLDPYDNEYKLDVGDEGVVDSGSGDVELIGSDDPEITYFYIRASKFVANSGPIWDSECDTEDPINPCLLLKDDNPPGIKECDIPQWSPVIYVSGTTTVFVNNQSLVLRGGGDMYSGIPPIPIALKEPLGISTVFRKVVYYYGSDDSEASDSLLSQEIEVDNNEFLDFDSHSYIRYTSDVIIRVQVLWKGEPVPDGTPVYVKVGEGDANTLFIPDRDSYYTETHPDEGYSYVDITLTARKVPTQTTTEIIEVYSTYDKKNLISRHMSLTYSLTIELSEAPVDEAPDGGTIVGPVIEPPTPYSKTLQRYNISTNEWDAVANMSEGKGNLFAGSIDDYIYVSGGLKNNSLSISGKTEKYNPHTNVWEFLDNIPTPRFAGMTVVYDGKLYAIGGVGKDLDINGLNVLRNLEVYNPSLDQWEIKTSMPTKNHGSWTEKMGVAFGTAVLVVVGSKPYIYVMSGISEFQLGDSYHIDRYNDRILRYSINDDLWEYSEILRSDELINYRRISPLSVVYANNIIVFGGAIEDGTNFIYPADSFMLTAETNFTKAVGDSWITVGTPYFREHPVPRYQAAMAGYEINPSDYLGHYYIIGGSNNNAPSLDIVEDISTDTTPFGYQSSYDGSPSLSIASIPIAVHGASAVFGMGPSVLTTADNPSFTEDSPYIYVIGGYTIAQEDSYVDISFDI